MNSKTLPGPRDTALALPRGDEDETQDQFLFSWAVELTEKLYLKESGGIPVAECWSRAQAFVDFVAKKAAEGDFSL